MDLNDKAVFLSEYKGKKTVLALFWTTWCPYCREELKKLNQEYAGLAKDSIELLAINVGEPKSKVDNFIKSRNLTTHTYDESTAAEIGSAVIHSYFAEFENFQTRMTKLKEESV